MNQPPHPTDPPFGSDTDEALNALIDGELGAFAAERRISEAAAREQLAAWPDFAARRDALEQVRRAVGTPTPPIDDLTRRRLVRTAANAVPGSSAPTARRSRPWAKIVAVAAAGLLVVAGVGYAISSTGSDEKSADSSAGSSSASTKAEPLRGNVGDLGDVSSREALRALLDRRAAESDAAGDESFKRSSGDAASSLVPTPGAVDPAECARELAGTRSVAFTGTGTYRGTPVTIVGITEGGRTIVFVVPSTNCSTVLVSISR